MCLLDLIEFIIGFFFLFGLMVYYILASIINAIAPLRSATVEFYREFIKKIQRLLFTQYKREEYDDNAVERGDAYIDKLLQDLLENREEYDPYEIDDSVIGFNKKVFFVNVSGEAKLHNGYIKGLSTLHRPNHCSLSEDGERLLVKADLGAGQLDFGYAGSVKFMNFGPTINVQGILSYIEVHLEFSVDSKTGRKGRLEKFIIDDMRGMKVWVTGLGPVNWAVNPIISGVTKIFKRFVRNFLENKVEKHIAERIPNFQFPIEGNGGEEFVTDENEVTETEQSKQTNPSDSEATSMEKLELTSEPELETTSRKQLELTREPELETTSIEKLELTSEPELETTSREKLELTSEPEIETTSTEKLEFSDEPELENVSEEELENTNSKELDEKQPKFEISNEQLEKQPETAPSSNEQFKNKQLQKTKIKVEKVKERANAVSPKSEMGSSEELDESDMKENLNESEINSSFIESLSLSEEYSEEQSDLEDEESLDESFQQEELPEDANNTF